ncbi:DinB family protein [Cohnella nanjingensis]|uniref:DinB family protein n=1 Tax=Cohnella nanjingensis TaxID=1387779 RepID=A0A7X0VEP7_9BACL|nr:DinB family protein [Cohnella nanjingensis]MBB6671227.1 DinB family protein [Cohnella nanjingensis]
MSHIVLQSAPSVRQLAIGQLQAIPEERFDIRPEGWNNTIRWHAGHLAYWMDTTFSLCFGKASTLPADYAAFFASGTKPADWTAAPPTKEALIGQLTAQLGRMSEIRPEDLDAALGAPLEVGPLKFETAGTLYNFQLMHEAMHLGKITSLLTSVEKQQA